MPSGMAGERAYAFLILMMMVTILLISLTTALPSIYQEGQREKEEELIFRGNEYARAILFFHNKFGRYPSSVDELVKKTNGIRFLRHAYRDPMTLKGAWRFIHANAAGMVIDSKTMTLPMNINNKSGLNPGGQQNVGPGQSGTGSIFGLNPPGRQSSGPSQPAPTGSNEADPQDQQNSEPSTTSQSSDSQTGASTTGDSKTGESKTGDSFSSSNQMHGAFIVGVASTSQKRSIRTYNNETEYDKWEFLAVGRGVASLLAPGGQTSPTGQPGTGQNPARNPGTAPGPVGGPGGDTSPPPPPDQPQIPY